MMHVQSPLTGHSVPPKQESAGHLWPNSVPYVSRQKGNFIDCLFSCAAKLVETGTFGGEEDDDVLFDDMVDDYEDEDEAIDAVSGSF